MSTGDGGTGQKGGPGEKESGGRGPAEAGSAEQMPARDLAGLTARDLITTGVFTAVFLVFMIVGSAFFAPNPVLTFWMPAASALLTGPVYLLLIAKVPKHGPLAILGVVIGTALGAAGTLAVLSDGGISVFIPYLPLAGGLGGRCRHRFGVRLRPSGRGVAFGR